MRNEFTENPVGAKGNDGTYGRWSRSFLSERKLGQNGHTVIVSRSVRTKKCSNR